MLFYLWLFVALSAVLAAPGHPHDLGETSHAHALAKSTQPEIHAKSLLPATLGNIFREILGLSTHAQDNQNTQAQGNQNIDCQDAKSRREHEAYCATQTTSSTAKTSAKTSSTIKTSSALKTSSTAKTSTFKSSPTVKPSSTSTSSFTSTSSSTATSSTIFESSSAGLTTQRSSAFQASSTAGTSSVIGTSSVASPTSTGLTTTSAQISSSSETVTTVLSSTVSSSVLTASTAISSATTVLTNTTSTISNSTVSCINSASNRSCWGDYDISTNYYDVVPNTGVTREYWFNVENITAAPDGVERVVLAVNGSVPGPTIIADWGDEIVVHVTNNMANNGSTIHWHGIRQNYTNYMDGVPSVTQCPIAPGDTQTYKWRATQYGTSWYHSHFSVQAWDGVFGGILINGPATADYDEDLGHVFLNDWSHQTADVLALQATITGPPTLQNCLINGTNTWTADDGTVVGSRFETNFVAGTRYRMRLVNGAADTHFRFTIDNHTLEVIANDFVPINPYTTTDLSIGIGQRYDVIVTATETTGNFWIRAIPQESCSDNDNVDNILGILRYDSSSTADPTSTAYASLVDSCDDETATNLVPYLSMDVGSVTSEDDEAAELQFGTTIKWTMNAVSFVSEWEYPTVLAISEGNDTWTAAEHVWTLPNADEWVQMIIQTDFAQAHPIHLHGHDFWVLGSGTGAYANGTALQTVGTPRRDVAMLPAGGWLALAWKTDNPGAWIMHCHIAWHAAEGFALQLVEREPEINALQDNDYIADTCTNWNTYVATDGILQDDSGI